MKILFIHNIIAPYRTPLFKALSKKYNIKVLFLERNDKNRKWNQESKNLNFEHDFLENNNYSIFNKKIIINSGFKKFYNDYQPDILVTLDNPSNFLTVIYSIYIAKKNKIPVILWTGAFEGYETFQKTGYKSKLILYGIYVIRKYIYANTDYFWAYSQSTKNYLIKNYLINKNKIFDGLQGYPDELIHFGRVNLKQRYENNKLLFIGYLDERKGIKLLLDVFQSLLKEFPNYILQIIGTGQLLDELVNTYKDIKNIKFLGYKDGIDKFNIINESKYLILPSYSDPWGWVVNEAASCKLPVLVSDSVMAKEILSDDMLIFRTGNIIDFTKHLKNIILLSYDKYQLLSEDMYANSRLHTLDKTINSFHKITKELI